MNRMLWKAFAAVAALAALAPAHAQMRYRGMPEQRDLERHSMPSPPVQSPRDFQPRQDFMPAGRLSPEERRQLRRDIHEAGRELYRGHPPQQPPR